MFLLGLLFVVLGAAARRLLRRARALILIVGFLRCSGSSPTGSRCSPWAAAIVTPEEAPELHGIVDRLCALADMPKPKVAIADTDMPNAFATGRNPEARGRVRDDRHHASSRRARARGRARRTSCRTSRTATSR